MHAARLVPTISLAIPAVLALAIGVGVAVVPTEITLFAILAALGVSMVIALRAAILVGHASAAGPRQIARVQATPAIGESTVSSASLGAEVGLRRVARLVYLLGLALMGVQLLRPSFGLTVSDLFFLLATLGAGIVVWRERIDLGSIYPSLLVVGAALFAIGTFVSTIGASDPGDSVAQLVKFLFIIFGWFGASAILLDRPRYVVYAVAAWVGTVAVNGVAALVQFAFGDVIPGATVAWGRMAGLTDHFNDLGGSAGVALPAAIMLAVAARRGLAVVAWTATALVVAALLLSGSVGGVVAAVVGCAAVLATGRVPIGRRTAIRLVGGLSVIVVGTTVLTSLGVQTPLARLDVAAGAGGTFASRVQTYEQALWSIGLDPVIGTGLSQGPTRTGYDVHSLLLGAWYQTGLVGLAGLFVIIVGGSALAIFVARRFSEPPLSSVAVGIVGAFAAFLVLGLAQPLLIQRYAWVPLALLLALAVEVRSRPGRTTQRDLTDQPPL